jgi:superfamily II DNA or RNA helicase
MSYFSQAYNLIRYVLAGDGQVGLRKSQVGALHATSAHFTLQERPAIIVLPTGAGKTAVLMLTPYILRASRTLIITQSRFVRDQITQDYKALRTLKLVQALPEDLPPPAIFENKKTICSIEEWETFRQYDAVIALPNSASPAYKQIPSPPRDLFDLVLIDEAHHSTAPTWNALMDAFPYARCVLFTATPFRRDGKEIKGKYVYTYPIQRAFEDGIYGEMLYVPVESAPGTSADVELAREAARVFREDADTGFTHVVMVRADSRPRANELAEIYRQHTTLKLEIVHSGRSQRHTEQVVQRLRQGDLDGVICVNMLGEGFDLPHLKIAALHAPHRSLAVTLQFWLFGTSRYS